MWEGHGGPVRGTGHCCGPHVRGHRHRRSSHHSPGCYHPGKASSRVYLDGGDQLPGQLPFPGDLQTLLLKRSKPCPYASPPSCVCGLRSWKLLHPRWSLHQRNPSSGPSSSGPAVALYAVWAERFPSWPTSGGHLIHSNPDLCHSADYVFVRRPLPFCCISSSSTAYVWRGYPFKPWFNKNNILRDLMVLSWAPSIRVLYSKMIFLFIIRILFDWFPRKRKNIVVIGNSPVFFPYFCFKNYIRIHS